MPFFPNSLELERRLRMLGADPMLLADAFAQLEQFKVRFRDEIYMLMSMEQLCAPDLAETLSQATGTEPCNVCFMSNAECKAMPRDKQYDLYLLARENSLRKLLANAGLRAFCAGKDEDGRRMIDVIKGAIGTRRLTLALDNTFGNSFASLFKRDIVAVWVAYFMAFVPKAGCEIPNLERIRWLTKLVAYLPQTLPALRLAKTPYTWTAFTA